MLILSANVDQKSFETVFDRHLSPDWATNGNRKNMSLAIFDPRLSIYKSVFIFNYLHAGKFSKILVFCCFFFQN